MAATKTPPKAPPKAQATLAEGRHTALPDKDRPNEIPCSHLPGLVIFVHGVNSTGEWYNEAEEGLCAGLNDRLWTEAFVHGGTDAVLSPNQYLPELTEEGEVDSTLSAKTFITKSGHSPVIRFRWGYKADPDDLTAYESQIWLDQKTKSWGGGPFQNGTSCLTDLWGGGINDRLFFGVAAQNINPTSRPLYGAPERNYYVHAADRLARLVERIRKRHNGTPITIVCHSQGNMVGITAAFIGANRNPEYVADTYILCNPPYSPESSLMYSYVNGLGGFWGRTSDKRLAVLKSFVDLVRQRGAISDKKQPLDEINNSLGMLKDGKPLVLLKKIECGSASTDSDRDNRGKVFLYCNPHDQLIGASPIQGMGWRGLTQKELKAVDPSGNTFFIRVWAQGVKVGDPRGKSSYHYWDDHWLTLQNNNQHPDEWWYPKSPPVKYRATWKPSKKSFFEWVTSVFGLLDITGRVLTWTILSVGDVRVQGMPSKSHCVPVNAPPVPTPVMPATRRAGTSAGSYEGRPALPHSDFDEGDDYGRAVREGPDNADRRLIRYEDKATHRLYEAQARKDGLEEGSGEWKQAVNDRELSMINFPPENATDHGTIVGNPEHCRHVMARDLALGVCRLREDELLDLRKFADWRFCNRVEDDADEGKKDYRYFDEGMWDGDRLSEGRYATDRRESMAPGIDEGLPQERLVFDIPEKRAKSDCTSGDAS